VTLVRIDSQFSFALFPPSICKPSQACVSLLPVNAVFCVLWIMVYLLSLHGDVLEDLQDQEDLQGLI
jgi:hypothetical protein